LVAIAGRGTSRRQVVVRPRESVLDGVETINGCGAGVVEICERGLAPGGSGTGIADAVGSTGVCDNTFDVLGRAVLVSGTYGTLSQSLANTIDQKLAGSASGGCESRLGDTDFLIAVMGG
jgi:hypothetical protein